METWQLLSQPNLNHYTSPVEDSNVLASSNGAYEVFLEKLLNPNLIKLLDFVWMVILKHTH